MYTWYSYGYGQNVPETPSFETQNPNNYMPLKHIQRHHIVYTFLELKTKTITLKDFPGCSFG